MTIQAGNFESITESKHLQRTNFMERIKFMTDVKIM
jgi:hypothetical protein